MSLSRDLVLVILVIGTATLWIDELKTFALSLVAVAAAIVIATKELIMGAAGTFLRTSSRSFEIGDRIEVVGVRGDVVDTNLFTTTILEIGPGHIGHQQTGRAVTVPNSVFLLQPVINETFSDAYVLHTFEVPVARDERWHESESNLLLALNEAQATYAAEAKAYFERRQIERGIESPTLDPRVLVRVDDPQQLTLIARLPVPARRKGRIEQTILHRFLSWPTTTTPTTAKVAETAQAAAASKAAE
jgi:small-conductance mechanosensitive channel